MVLWKALYLLIIVSIRLTLRILPYCFGDSYGVCLSYHKTSITYAVTHITNESRRVFTMVGASGYYLLFLKSVRPNPKGL